MNYLEQNAHTPNNASPLQLHPIMRQLVRIPHHDGRQAGLNNSASLEECLQKTGLARQLCLDTL